jgi:hypothetical protein
MVHGSQPYSTLRYDRHGSALALTFTGESLAPNDLLESPPSATPAGGVAPAAVGREAAPLTEKN